MRKVVLKTAALLAGGLVVSPAAAQQLPSVEKLLSYKPVQPGVLCDNPAPETWTQCKVEVYRGSDGSGYVVRDTRGLTVRRLLAVGGAKGINQKSYFMQGHEVYREVDTNDNREPDQFRWFNAGGSRTGKSARENGKIDQWTVLSAEEATAEAVAAAQAQDWARMQAVMLTANDVKSLGLDEKSANRVLSELQKAGSDFQKFVSAVPPTAKWARFDGQLPMAIPGLSAGSERDLVLYHNGTISIEVGENKTLWLRAPEVVKIGDVWKLTTVPVAISDSSKPIETVGVLVPAIDLGTRATQISGDSPVEADDKIQELVAELQKHDEGMPKDGDAKALTDYHIKRHTLCLKIGSASRKLSNIAHWYRQAADSLDGAVQTKQYDAGVKTLEDYSKAFVDRAGKDETPEQAKTMYTSLAAYFKYRAINASYATRVDDKDSAKAQEKFLVDLAAFVKDFPGCDDSADALWQLGNGAEFALKDADALGHYRKLVEGHEKSSFAKKAAGAVRRIESVGRPMRFAGAGLDGSRVDTGEYAGKVVLVHYWATWCEACMQEMPKIAAAHQKFAGKGLAVVGVNLDNDTAKATQVATTSRIAWPTIHEKGGLDSEPAIAFGIVLMPTVVLLDESGKVLSRNVNANQLEVEIEKALAKKIASKPE